MTSRSLDPWDDAPAIAEMLQQPGAELTVVLGAEAWCEKCRRLRPLFDAMQTEQPAAGGVALWLDLEDHAEFIGRFVPDDLPLMLRWRGGACVRAAVLLDSEPEMPARWKLQELAVPAELPDLWAGFARGDWASGSQVRHQNRLLRCFEEFGSMESRT